jgi:hypothetical protein
MKNWWTGLETTLGFKSRVISVISIRGVNGNVTIFVAANTNSFGQFVAAFS